MFIQLLDVDDNVIYVNANDIRSFYANNNYNYNHTVIIFNNGDSERVKNTVDNIRARLEGN